MSSERVSRLGDLVIEHAKRELTERSYTKVFTERQGKSKKKKAIEAIKKQIGKPIKNYSQYRFTKVVTEIGSKSICIIHAPKVDPSGRIEDKGGVNYMYAAIRKAANAWGQYYGYNVKV